MKFQTLTSLMEGYEVWGHAELAAVRITAFGYEIYSSSLSFVPKFSNATHTYHSYQRGFLFNGKVLLTELGTNPKTLAHELEPYNAKIQ